MTDVFPEAPGESGSTDNLTKLLGIGAFAIDNGGGSTNFGQNITEGFVNSLIHGQANSLAAIGANLEEFMEQLGDYLKTFELQALKALQPLIPGATDADFATVDLAIAKILESLGLKWLMGGDEFQQWLNDIFDPNSALWSSAKAQWDSVQASFVALQALLAGGSVTTGQWATWWSNLFIALGVGSTDAANMANFLSGNYDAAKQAKANWDAFLAGWGIGTPAAIGAATSLNITRAQRRAVNDDILRDGWHTTYPVGSITDTATTLVGGKRTWWGAFNDNLLLTAQMLGLAPVPATVDADIGTATQLAAATASAAGAAASLAQATNQDLTNKIIASQTGVEPTTGTAADAQNALENIPASNIAGQTGALVTYGATGSVAGAGPGTFSGNNSGTMTFTPLSTDTTLDIIVTYYGGQSSTRTITADVGGTPLALVNHVAGNAYGSNVPEIAVYRLTLTPSGSPPTITVNINVASTNGNSYWSAVGISYYGIKVNYSAVYNGAIGTNTTTPVSMTRNSDNNKRIFQVLTHVSNGTVTRTLTGGGTQRVNFSGSTPAIFIQDIQGAAAPGVTTLSCNLVTGAGISGSWAGMLVEMSN